MNIKTRNKRSTDFSSSTMSDLVFLLLIFFMLTSSVVSPNAIKLLLPSSTTERVPVNKKAVNVYIDEKLQYSIDKVVLDAAGLRAGIMRELEGQTDASVVLRSDASVPIQFAVNVIDIVNSINKEKGTKHKVVLATRPEDKM
ncbi:MAG TPA: biopolymer transporter ExbD [Bacteroidales bacterium]|nr:biopolymer transporter ExbD [Bacteroidales bacterium]